MPLLSIFRALIQDNAGRQRRLERRRPGRESGSDLGGETERDAGLGDETEPG
jgi:hypothetical protein